MFYPKNQEPQLSEALFKKPTSEYRGTPFWAWNGRLDYEELIRQIHIFKKMGLGGFHMHVRTGLQDPYLTESFMSAIRACVEEAKKEEMLAYLYDEDRWPSGSAGGKVTASHPEYARQMLMLTRTPYAENRPHLPHESRPGYGQGNMRQDNGFLICVYDILLDDKGKLLSWKSYPVKEGEDPIANDPSAENAASVPAKNEKVLPEEKRYYAYIEHTSDDPWFNDHPYVDTMNPEAIREFLNVTHEAYAKEFLEDFGSVIPSIFTDEPQYAPKKALEMALKDNDLSIPWTKGLEELFAERYGDSLLEKLPELFWERADEVHPLTRWQYQNLVTDRFVESFCKQVGDWCDEHHIALTGHVMNEPTLYSQTLSVGDAMRCYKPFGIPGIDMLCDHHEFTTAKQTQSMVRQLGKEGMLSELYGVTGWDYDFRGYKLQGDWQAALGVTVRVPHLAWESMHGEAKRDYPASISFQSPWWEKYHLVEDHFARVNTALTRGRAISHVAILHPIESYWLLWGPNDQTAALRDQMDKQFQELAKVLLLNQMDYDYLDEARLTEMVLPQEKLPQGAETDRPETTDTVSAAAPGTLTVGLMNYETVVIPPVITIRSTTIRILHDFMKRGGRILVQGEEPKYIDAELVKRMSGEKNEIAAMLHEVYERAERCGQDPYSLLEMLEKDREISVRLKTGERFEKVLYQLREDSNCRWLFLANGVNPESPDTDPMPEITIGIRGKYKLTCYDTMTGEIFSQPAVYENGQTKISMIWHSHDSRLWKLEEVKEAPAEESSALAGAADEAAYLAGPQTRFGLVKVDLSEPNMLLLDEAEWSMNGEPYRPTEELLRIDNYARGALSIPLRLKEVAQPYTIEPVIPKDTLTLRFRFTARADFSGCHLALENADKTWIRLNGETVFSIPDGTFVDPCIETVPLPVIPEGENTIEVMTAIGPNTDLEYYYLLGDFGVRLRGTVKELTPPDKKIGFGDICMQEMPFYTGNIDYHMTIRCRNDFEVRVPHYRGGLVEVLLDGESCGHIIGSPYRLKIPANGGEHDLVFRLYGTRQNGFAQLHYTPGVVFYQSPNSWRSAGDLWSYEYHFKPAGILKSPEVYGADILQEDGSIRPCDGSVTMQEKS